MPRKSLMCLHEINSGSEKERLNKKPAILLQVVRTKSEKKAATAMAVIEGAACRRGECN